MTKNRLFFRSFTLAVLFSGSVHAAIFVEPGRSYEFADSTIRYPEPLRERSSIPIGPGGPGMAVRIGGDFAESFFTAIDARFLRPRVRDAVHAYESVANAFLWGPVVGMIPWPGFRLWASWIAGGGITPDSGRGFNVRYHRARGFRMGMKFRVLFMNAHFEYQRATYGDLEIANVVNRGSRLLDRSYVLSLSFPLED